MLKALLFVNSTHWQQWICRTTMSVRKFLDVKQLMWTFFSSSTGLVHRTAFKSNIKGVTHHRYTLLFCTWYFPSFSICKNLTILDLIVLDQICGLPQPIHLSEKMLKQVCRHSIQEVESYPSYATSTYGTLMLEKYFQVTVVILLL